MAKTDTQIQEDIDQNTQDTTTEESTAENSNMSEDTPVLKAPQTVPSEVVGHNVAHIKDAAKFPSRYTDSALVNHSEQGTMSFALRDGKYASLAASKTAVFKMDYQGQGQKIVSEDETTTNKWRLNTKEIIINGHKLNRALYEYTDFKTYEDPYGNEHIVGNFMIDGTVLVRAWDLTLRKNMLIRRPARLHMFGNLLNVPEIDEGLEITDPSVLPLQYKASQETSDSVEFYNLMFDEHEFNQKLSEEATKNNGAVSTGADGSTPGYSYGGGGGGNVGSGTAPADVIEKALQWCIQIANEEPHYYSQDHDKRSGPLYYDCTSFISTALSNAGMTGFTPPLGGPAFDDILIGTGLFNLVHFNSEQELQRGDILTNDKHVAFYLGGGKIVHARGKERPPADQICVSDYYNGFEYVLRYIGSQTTRV